MKLHYTIIPFYLLLGGCFSSAQLLNEQRRANTGQSTQECYHTIIKPAVRQLGKTYSVNNQGVPQTQLTNEIINAPEKTRFRTPCPEQMTSEFILTLQNALKSTGYFPYRITGSMDVETKRAIKLYQKQRALDSDIVSWKTLESLGIEPL